MPSILVIDKGQGIKELSIKKYAEDELYKKAGFKSSEHFKCHATWNVELNGKKYSVCLYGKTEGRANQENKYDFPPPVDNLLFFGSCVLVNKQNDNAGDLKESEWTAIYNHLFGGFEDIGSEDSDEDEEESIDGPVTKEGYSKDGFVVDDDDGSKCDDDESEEEVRIVKKTKKSTGSIKKNKTVVAEKDQVKKNDYLDCSSELSEDAYF
jgi:hypothetical protein